MRVKAKATPVFLSVIARSMSDAAIWLPFLSWRGAPIHPDAIVTWPSHSPTCHSEGAFCLMSSLKERE